MNLHIVLKYGLSNHNALRWASELVIKVFWSRMCFSDDGSPMNRVCKQATWLHWCQGRPISSSSTPFLTMTKEKLWENSNFNFTKFHKFYQISQVLPTNTICLHIYMLLNPDAFVYDARIYVCMIHTSMILDPWP